ncbi:MAG TPA: thiamine diphosphokinase, partial [Actinobacteria bacterium]|nr:thiamine diphosphokinase [Actinomycetota bacterium]
MANGPIKYPEKIRRILDSRSFTDSNALIVSADGGVSNTLELGLMPDIIIGDMDSIDRDIKKKKIKELLNTKYICASHDKDESDSRLAVEHAVEMGIKKIIITGALGDRMDHSFANMMLLASPALDGIDIKIITDDSEIFVINKSCTVDSEPGKLISIFSLSPYTYFIKTKGLKYGLKNEKLDFSPVKGLSNVFTAAEAEIDIKEGQLLIIRQ